MAGDIYFDKVSLLLHFGATADNSTTTANPPADFVDSSKYRRTPYSVASARLRTGTKMFGSGSMETYNWSQQAGLKYDGITLGTDDFTAEFGFKYVGCNGASQIPLWGVGNIMLMFAPGSNLGWKLNTNNYYTSTPISSMANKFYKLRVVRSSGTFYLFIDGILSLTTTVSANSPGGGAMYLGSPGDADGNRAYGYYDEFRLTQGVARSTANYTVDTAEFPNYMAQFSGNVKDDTGTNAARLIRAYKESDGSFAGETTSDGSTGNYVLGSYTGSACTLVSYPLSGDALNAVVLRGVVPV